GGRPVTLAVLSQEAGNSRWISIFDAAHPLMLSSTLPFPPTAVDRPPSATPQRRTVAVSCVVGCPVYTLGEAARASGKGKSTIAKAIKSGRISATRDPDGSYRIDPAELHR